METIARLLINYIDDDTRNSFSSLFGDTLSIREDVIREGVAFAHFVATFVSRAESTGVTSIALKHNRRGRFALSWSFETRQPCRQRVYLIT